MAPRTNRNLLVLDGGMSRELIRFEAPFRQPEWSALALIEAPHFVRQVHSAFATAGADVLTTNSYALVPFHIGEERFRKQGEQLASLAGRLAREVADDEAQSGSTKSIAGSLPPIFGSYEPARFDAGRVQDYLAVLVRGLAPYVDIWLGETLSLIAEAEAVRTAVVRTGIPFWIAFTLEDVDETLAEPRLRSGETVADAAKWALKSGTEALLFNCSKPEVMAAAVRVTKEIFSRSNCTSNSRRPRIGVYANAFEPKASEQAANEVISASRADLNEDAYLTFAQEWLDGGASIVGGCCGIGSQHIRRIAHELRTGPA